MNPEDTDLFGNRRPDRGIASENARLRFMEHWITSEVGALSPAIASDPVISAGMQDMFQLLDDAVAGVREAGQSHFVRDATDHEVALALYFVLHEKYSQRRAQNSEDRGTPQGGQP